MLQKVLNKKKRITKFISKYNQKTKNKKTVETFVGSDIDSNSNLPNYWNKPASKEDIDKINANNVMRDSNSRKLKNFF